MKLNVLYTINKSKVNSKGLCGITCRLTYLKSRKQFSTGLFINPIHWNNKQQLIKPPEPYSDLLNSQLSLIRNKLNQAFLFLQVNEKDFDVFDIYMQYNGRPINKECGVMEAYRLLCERQKRLIGIDLVQRTYNKYLQSGVHLQDFIRYRFKQKDIKLSSLKSTFLEQYEYYLKTEKKLQLSTINKAIQRFRKSIIYAISEEYLARDPFILYKAKRVRKDVVYLSPEQLKKLEETDFPVKRIQQIKDMFVFCCYTGLGFTEMSRLKKVHITKEFDGELWINVRRGKTRKVYKVPLLPKAKEIMEKYSNYGEHIFPRMSNTKFNLYLKEIADVVGIDFNLTHHIARKTFATTVLLYNGIPLDIVSKLLGHSKLQTTQEHYGEIVQKRISLEIEKLKGSG